MMINRHYLAVFESRNHAILVYSLLEEGGQGQFQLIFTPCSLQAGCGYSIRYYNKSLTDTIIEKVKEENLSIPKFYYGENIQGNIRYRALGI